jgi:hypothetical protein
VWQKEKGSFGCRRDGKRRMGHPGTAGIGKGQNHGSC